MHRVEDLVVVVDPAALIAGAAPALGVAATVDDREWESALAAARRVARPDRDPVHCGGERPATPADPSMPRLLSSLGRDDRARVD